MLKGRVLLLNANYTVLGTIGVARAIRMSLRQENPVIVHEYIPSADGKDYAYLTSGNGAKYPIPSVISLKHFVDIRKKRQESGAKRMKIYVRDKYQCQYCSVKIGKPYFDAKLQRNRPLEVKDLTLDHITPKAQDGSNHPSNLVTACMKCNQKKANKTPEQARMPLRTQIHDVTNIGLDKIMLCKYVEHRKEWLPYLESQDGFKEIIEDLGFAKAA